jgi:hypothetical protein
MWPATFDSVERCRRQFPELRILSGVELGQPHIDAVKARQPLDLSALDRLNGSLHTLPISDESGGLRYEPITLYRQWPAGKGDRGVSGRGPAHDCRLGRLRSVVAHRLLDPLRVPGGRSSYGHAPKGSPS